VVQEEPPLTPSDVRAAAGELVHLRERLAPWFGRKEARAQSLLYLRGLRLAPGRKSAEPMAVTFGEPDDDGISQNQVLALPRFPTKAPRQAEAVQRAIQAAFAEAPVPATAGWAIGTVGALGEAGVVKQGTHGVGVQRQSCGRVGKRENGPVGVLLVGVTPAGTALVDHHLYLPHTRAQDPTRRRETAVPEDVVFRTEPQSGLALLRRTRARGPGRWDWVTADAHYGQKGAFPDELEALPQRYLVAVPRTTTVGTIDPATQVPPQAGRRGPPHEDLYPKNNPVLLPPVNGKVGLWSKTDSTSYFKDYVVSPK